MRHMFKEAETFNQDIGKWNVSNVIHMGDMFKGATAFNQDLSNWMVLNVDPKVGMRDMFKNSGYKHTKPTIERAKERLKDKENFEDLRQQANSNNPDYFKNNLHAKEVLTEQGLRDKIGENFG